MKRTTFLTACLLGLVCGCGNPTTPCGTFSFSGTPDGAYLDVVDSFAFDENTSTASATTPGPC